MNGLAGVPRLMTNKNSDLLSGLAACVWSESRRRISLALNLLMLTVPLHLMSVYDRVLTSRSEETLLMLSLVAVGALAGICILDAVRQLVLTRAGVRLETGLGVRC